MKGNLHKVYKFATIITEEDLRSISSLVLSKFDYVRYEIKTKDGAEYCVDNLDSILNYDNHDYRKIVLFRVKGNRRERDSFVFPNISISLYDNSIYQEACILDINGLEDTDIVYFSQKVKDFTNQIKAPYWWCHTDSFYFVLGIILYILFGIIYLINVNNEEAYDKIYNILILQGISAICMFVSMYFGQKLVSYIFPEGCFCIGEQKRYIKRKEKYRSIIFWSILVTIILGVISNIISHLVIKTYL